MEGYTKSQAYEKTGLHFRSIQYYTERNVVTPGVDEGSGTGKKRLYNEENLVEIGILRALNDYGMSFHVVKNMMIFIMKAIKREFQERKETLFNSLSKQQRGVYVIVYHQQGDFFVGVKSGIDVHQAIDPGVMGLSESGLIIDLGRIVQKIKRS